MYYYILFMKELNSLYHSLSLSLCQLASLSMYYYIPFMDEFNSISLSLSLSVSQLICALDKFTPLSLSSGCPRDVLPKALVYHLDVGRALYLIRYI